MTSKNNRAPLVHYIKLCASFQIHQWNQTGVTVWKHSVQVKIDDFLSRMTLKFDRWPWKTIGLLFYATSSILHNFVAIGEFKLELQSGDAQFGWNLTIFELCDLEICRITLNKANLRDLIAATGLLILLKFDPNHPFFSLCDLEIWCMTSKNNRAPLLYYTKLCVSFQIHRWIQTEVTLRKRSIWVEIGDFLSIVTLKFDGWPGKTIVHLFYTTSSFVHHFKSIGELKLKLQSRNTQFGSKSAIFCPVWPWNLTDALEKQ